MKQIAIQLLVGLSVTMSFVFLLIGLRSTTGIDPWHFAHVGSTGIDSHFVVTFVTRGAPKWQAADSRNLNYREMQVPYWSMVLIFASPGIWWLMAQRKLRRMRQAGMCVQCGYDLRASPQRCPECGTVPMDQIKATPTSVEIP